MRRMKSILHLSGETENEDGTRRVFPHLAPDVWQADPTCAQDVLVATWLGSLAARPATAVRCVGEPSRLEYLERPH